MNSCPPFVRKIFQLVSDNNTNSIVSWSDNGTTFTVWNAQAFQKQILPQYFKHSNLCSFIRQLNTYGFHKVNCSNGEGGNLQFSHPQFQKNGKHLLPNICRKSKGKSKTSKCINADIRTPSPVALSPDCNAENVSQTQVAEALISLVKRQQESEMRLMSICKELEEAKNQIDLLRSYPVCGKRKNLPSSYEPQAKKIKTEHNFIESIDELLINNSQEMISFDDLFHMPMTNCATETREPENMNMQTPFDVNMLLDF